MVGFGRRRKSPNPIVSVSRRITICRLLACYRVGDVACREGTGTGTMIPDDSAFFWGWEGGEWGVVLGAPPHLTPSKWLRRFVKVPIQWRVEGRLVI